MATDFVQFFINSLPDLFSGLGYTLLLTFISITAGFFLGLALGLGRVYGNKIVNGFCVGYIELIRGTPLLVQLFIIYFGLPQIGIIFSPIQAALLGLALNSGAYQAEYLRGSIQSVESGQMSAARSLGMNRLGSIRHVILPQALRISIPAWSNEFIYLLQYSSIAYIIGVTELTAEGKFIAGETFRYLEMFAMIAVIYLILTIVSTEIIDRVAKHFSIPGIGAAKRVSLRDI
ncbi:MAG TPA: amino acid ABC transporter permease [Candidatus Thermoplasmatota archaeon]|nr:amino acid ABC transporter permease [Candidatus Thermoplasmatota archaeon]